MNQFSSESLPDLRLNRPLYADAADALTRTVEDLPHSPFGDLTRVSLCYQLFHATEALVLKNELDHPAKTFRDLLGRFRRMLEGVREVSELPAFTSLSAAELRSVEAQTASHYGALFADFSAEQYFEEPAAVLRQRLGRNDLLAKLPLEGKALDAGCGGGRYAFALKGLGFAEVVGVDHSEQGIRFANRQLAARPTPGLSFRTMDVLDLAFEDRTFDFVFSNGVLHHTTNLTKGLAEIARVLRPGGFGFLYLIESPGGIHWDLIDTLREVMAGVSAELARGTLALLGVPANRRFYILDHVMVPVNTRLTIAELEQFLTDAGFSDFRRLERGCDYDRIEAIFQQRPYAGVKYGVGEHRYALRKR